MCRLLRSPVALVLALVLFSAGHCTEKSESSAGLKDRQNLLNLIMEIIQELKKFYLEEDEENGVQYSSKRDYLLDRKGVPDYGAYSDRVGKSMNCVVLSALCDKSSWEAVQGFP